MNAQRKKLKNNGFYPPLAIIFKFGCKGKAVFMNDKKRPDNY